MPRDPALFRQRKEKYLRNWTGRGRGPISEKDRERILELVNAFDENKPTQQRPAWPDAPANLRGYRSETTLGNWVYFLSRYAKHISLTDATPHDVNQVAEDMLDGSHPSVKDSGLTKGTIRAHQNTLRIFYRYHDDLDVEWSDVTVFSRTNGNGGDSHWGPEDILTRDEIEELQNAATDFRDSAVFNLLLYTGMRNRALRTIRVKDVDPGEGFYRYNPEEGTKDIHEPRAKRPLFGAKGPVREWLKRHPTGEPEHYLITANSKFRTADPTEPVSDRTIGRVCERLKDAVGIDKPMHPHMLRHNFVYICKRAYEVPDDTIRFFLGHAPDSTIMEETYSHLSAEDHFERGRVAAGEIDASGEDIGFDLSTCGVCGEQLPETETNWCPKCGAALTPDAEKQRDTVQRGAEEATLHAESEAERRVVQAALREMRENPEEHFNEE